MLSNPKFIVILAVFVLFLGFFQIGCNKPDEQSNPVGSSVESLTGDNGTSRVDFKLVFPSHEISAQSDNFSFSNATPTTVIFRLKLLNYGNPGTPFFLVSKQVPVIDGAASATFDALPTTTVIGSVHIENGKIQGFSDFHGAHDLTRGINTVTLAPAGSLLPQDVVANAVEQIIASSTLFNSAPLNLVSELNKIVPTLMLDSPTAYNEIINNFANRNGLPIVELISPAMNQTFVFGTTVNLIASATDHDGNISRIEFFQGLSKIGETTSSPFSCNWMSASSGIFNLSAKAFDNNSAVGISKIVTVNITNASPAKYTVKYDGNGNNSGSVPTDNQDYQENSTVIVKDNSGNLTKTGYIFAGWNTSPDGSGRSYSANSNFLISGNITLYAQWQQSNLIWIPGNVTTSDSNFALGRPTATYANNSYSSQNAVDGNSMSRWEGNRNDPGPDEANPHFLIVDLQQIREVRNIKVNISGWDSWKQNFSVSISNDLDNWTQVASETDKTGIFSYNIQPANIRYVKFSSTYSADMDQVNLYELEVYGTEQKISKYTVTYNGNSNTTGSVPIDNNTYSEGESISVAGNTGGLTRTGFTFVGWNTKVDGTGMDYYEGYTLRMPAANLTFYAKWRSSELVWLPGNVPVSEANYALGRPTATYVGSSYSSQNAVDGNSMSRWEGSRNDPGPDEANPHFLIVDLQQTREVRNIKVNISGWDSWKQNFSVSTSNDLNNWNQVASETDKTGIFSYNIQPANIRYVKFSSTYSADMDQVNLYELEVYGTEQTISKYTVTYNGNSNTTGSVPIDNNTYSEGESISVAGNTGGLTRTGFTFVGWNTKADGTGMDYYEGYTLRMPAANLSLYAKWRSSELVWAPGTVAVNETNFAIGRPTASYVGNSFSSSSAVDGDNMSRWSGNRNDPGPDEANPHFLIVDLQQIREVRNIKVNISGWDSWKQNFSISISNDLNNWTQVASEIDKTGIFSYNIQPANIRYVKFSSTYSADMDQVNLYELEVYGSVQATTTYTVIYNGNGHTSGSIPIDNLTYPAGVNVTVQLNTGNLTRTGYSFAGWNTSSDGKGMSYSPGSSLIMTSANLTLYAVWVQNQTCSITYNGNGNTSGSVPIDSSAYLPGTTVTVKDNTGNLIKTGYSFSGWNTSADGTGGNYIAGTPLIIGSTNLTLYAKWTPNEQPPEIALLSPPNKAFGVASGSELKITFNKPVSKGTGNIFVHEKNGSLKEEIPVTGSNISISGNDLSIKLNSPLACDVFYYVTVESGVVKDASGKPFSGLSDSEAWSFKTMFEFSNTLTWNMEKIRAHEAWKYSTGEGVVVAVLDTGVDASHYDLEGQLTPEARDFVNDGTFCQDGSGHGTHVAGIIAAKANGIGPIGVAPKAKLYVSKVLGLDGSGYIFDAIAGIQDALDYGAKIINMSLGGNYYNSAYEDAVTTAYTSGAIIFAAAGNDGQTPINYPARYSGSVAIGATDRNDSHCLFSNYGPELWFTAPGESIVSAAPSPEYFAEKSGTSMATPHVSGVAALIWAHNPTFTSRQVLEALIYGSVDLGPTGFDNYFGCGRVDALKSLEYKPAVSSIRASRMLKASHPEKSDFTAKSFKKGELFLKLNPGYKLEDALNEAGLQNAGIKLLKHIRLTNLLLLSVPPGREAEIGKKLQSLPDVAYAELNSIVKVK